MSRIARRFKWNIRGKKKKVDWCLACIRRPLTRPDLSQDWVVVLVLMSDFFYNMLIIDLVLSHQKVL